MLLPVRVGLPGRMGVYFWKCSLRAVRGYGMPNRCLRACCQIPFWPLFRPVCAVLRPSFSRIFNHIRFKIRARPAQTGRKIDQKRIQQQTLSIALFIALFCSLACPAVSAGSFPERAVTIIVPFSRGGGLDVAVRLAAKYAEKELGGEIEVVNVTKGGNIAGNLQGIGAEPDGYTLLAWGSGLVTDTLLVKSASYTHLDVKPVCMFANDPELIVVNRAFAEENGIDSLDSLLEYVRAHPGAVTIGMGGNWTAHDFLRLKIETGADVKFNRMPFLGGAPALEATAQGECGVATPFVSEYLGNPHRDGVLPLAVAFGERVKQLPDIPSVAELGHPGMTQTLWRILSVPLGTPDNVVQTLENAFRRVLDNPDFLEEAFLLGINPEFKPAAELRLFLDSEFALYREITRELDIQVER